MTSSLDMRERERDASDRVDLESEGRRRAVAATFYSAVLGLAAVWLFVLPYDATDLCYLLSLEDGTWVTQEVVHPLWVPLLWLLRFVLRAFGWRGLVLVPIEAANVLVSVVTLILLFRRARQQTKDSVAAASAVLLLASSGFNSAAMRPTPYAAAFLCVAASLLLVVSDRVVSLARYLLAGALAGAAMALHASAMALAPAALVCIVLDPDRGTRGAAVQRVVSFGAGMVGVAGTSFAVWFFFNRLDVSFFEIGHLRSMFGGVEQVPGTSIYSSGSVVRQVTGLSATLSSQGGLLGVAGLIAWLLELRRFWTVGAAPTPIERRTFVAATALFAMFGAFFLINNYRNGFVYASLALFPLVVAQAASRAPWARVALVAAAVCAVSFAALRTLHAGMNRFHDPLPAEVRFVESAIGERAVLLVPGCAFDELRLLSSIQVFRVQIADAPPRECALPRAHVGDVLRARVRSWQEQGVRVFFAFGDEEHDFTGDANGAEKAVQLFWDPVLDARSRAPKLQAVRSAFAASGLRLGAPFVSPRGDRYAEVTADGGVLQAPEHLMFGHFDDAATHDPRAARRRAVLTRFHALVPNDPWSSCDGFCLGLTLPLASDRASVRATAIECACPDVDVASDSCAWGGGFGREAAAGYIVPWARRVGLGTPLDWGVDLNGSRARVEVKLQSGTLWVTWDLLATCAAGPVVVRTEGLSALPTADAMQDFAAHLPAPHRGGF
jgi:hypothetical protein